MSDYNTGNFADELEPTTIEAATKQHPRLVNTIQAFIPSLSEEEIAGVVALMEGTCTYCYEQAYGCQCGNDE